MDTDIAGWSDEDLIAACEQAQKIDELATAIGNDMPNADKYPSYPNIRDAWVSQIITTLTMEDLFNAIKGELDREAVARGLVALN